MRLDLCPMLRGDEGAGLGPVVEAMPEPDPLGPLAYGRHELVVDACLDDRPAARRAHLA
jgi:hypothetical protein